MTEQGPQEMCFNLTEQAEGTDADNPMETLTPILTGQSVFSRILPRTASVVSSSLLIVLTLGLTIQPLLASEAPQTSPSEGTEQEPRHPDPRIDNEDLYLKSLKLAVQSVEQFGLYQNPKENERVNRIGYELAMQTNYEKAPFTFTLIDMPIPNAFALPSGQIFVTRGMLELGLDDDMLAALLGHEIAHVTEQHFLKMKRKATLLNTLSTLVMAGAVYATTQSNDEYVGPYGVTRDNSTARLAQGAMQASILATELLMRGYSRRHEGESVEEGQRLTAAAGFGPLGAERLMAKMSDRIPQTRSYGYLMTHPYLEDRAEAAKARAKSLKIQPKIESTDHHRETTQAVLLSYAGKNEKLEPKFLEALNYSALNAWPIGNDADRLRLARLEKLKERELDELSLNRDFGTLIETYNSEIDILEELSPESALIARLRDDIGDFRRQLKEIYPDATRVLDGGIYETPFLETFQSNFPRAEEAAQIALALGTAYSRLGKETEAVENLLMAWELEPSGEIGTKAQAGLHNLAPILDRLGALEVLAAQKKDVTLGEVAIGRLDTYTSKFKQIDNGADYLERFPEGLYAATVRARLDHLADNLYREMVLYQQVGETAKSLERARQILEHAPLSPAAQRLGEETLENEA